MKILHLSWTLGAGGAEEMLVDIVNEQCCTEQVSMIIMNDPVHHWTLDRVNPAVKVVLLHRKPGSSNPLPFMHLNWLVNRIRPDVLHAHSWAFVKVLPCRPARTVLTVHTTRDANNFDRSVLQYDRVFAISTAVADDIQDRAGRLRTRVILNGINCEMIRSEPRPPDGVFRIVQIARLEHRHKGQDILLRALARLRDQHGWDSIRLDLIGEGQSRQYLENMVRELGLAESVRFRGRMTRSAIYQELCHYDLLVQASRYEGFGLSVVEAMAASVPVLVSDLEGPREIIEGGRFGFLFQPEDDFACARGIQYVREMQNTAMLARFVSAAKEHALANFDVKRTAKDYVREYEDMLGAQSPAEKPHLWRTKK